METEEENQLAAEEDNDEAVPGPSETDSTPKKEGMEVDIQTDPESSDSHAGMKSPGQYFRLS